MCILAHTKKGKGVSFVENNLDYHNNNVNDAEFQTALEELGEHYEK